MRLSALLISAGGLVAATPALAQTSVPAGPPDNSRLTVAVGAATVPDYEGADSNEIIPAAAVIGKLKGYDFFTRGTQLYVDVVRDNGGVGTKLELGPIAALRFNRTNDSSISNRQVRALGELDTAVELGGFVGIQRTGVITSDYDTVSARVAYIHDVAGAHDSYVVTPQLNYTTPLSIRSLVSLGVSSDYVGKGFGQYYFGVTPTGTAASGLRTYTIGDSGFKNVNLSAFAAYSLSGDIRHGFLVGAGFLYSRLFGQYKDSPLVRDVGDADQWSGAVGIGYTF